MPNRVSAFRPIQDLERTLVSSQQLRAGDCLAACPQIVLLKIESDLRRQRSRRYIVRSAERREKVIECILVGYVDRRQVKVQLVVFLVKDVLLSDGNIEQVARCDARRVLVIVFGSWRWNADQC